MKFRVFAFLLAAVSVFAYAQSDEWYQGKPIREIIFTGLKNVSQKELDDIVSPYKGRLFNDNLFLEIQGKLYALEYFDRLESSTQRSSPEGNDVIIRFTVSERPVISRINFIGNSGLRRHELMDVITTKVRDVYNQAKIRTDTEALINKYKEKGFPNAVVTSSESISGDASVILNFNITENNKISISKIEFHGNQRFSSNTLRNQLSLKAKSLLNDGAYNEAKLLADRETITKYYRDRGYIDAVVRDVTTAIEIDDKKNNMVLTFMIEEGLEYRFGGITFDGNIIFTTEQLNKLVYSKMGEIANMTRIEMDLQRVADLYFENGYIFNSLIRNPRKDNFNLIISYNVVIVERSRAYIENIIVLGNNKTKTHVITREIPMEPGDVFSRTKIMDAMRNLYNLQFFSVVIPDTLPGSTENLMDLVFTVEEQPTIDLQFGLTFSGNADPDTFPISGLLKWNNRNVAGSGNEFGVEINSSVVDSSTLSANYLHRWILGLPLSLGVDISANFTRRFATMNNGGPFNPIFNGDEPYAYPDGFYSYSEYDRNNKVPTRDFLMEYNQWYLSLGLSTGYRWATFLGNYGINGGVRTGMIRNSYDDIYRPFDPALRDGNNSWVPKNSVWFSTSLDQRDIFYDPSRGYYLYERIGFYGILPNEREHYMRSDSKIQFFHTLFNLPVTDNWDFKCVFGVNAGLSLIFQQLGRDAPTIEDANKVSVDGMFVGRGWSEAYRDKGLLLLDTWIELRFPLVRGIIAFDLFLDAAGVDNPEGSYFDYFGVGNLKFSYGGGIRFTMPQFPIRLSLAKRFEIVDSKVRWRTGALFGDPGDPHSFTGMDLVMSFVMSY
jgi:outer membrane protein insertion porin family